jgi:hypothetical protein
MSLGLPVNRLINVQVNISPLAAQFANFNSLLIIGDSDVISTAERIRLYSSLSAVATDFGTSAPEYAAALLFFSQSPQPTSLYIGRWAQAATKATISGGVLASGEQALSNWTSITAGSFKITIDGSLKTLTGLDFSAVTNLNGVASAIQTALAGSGTCTWNGQQFTIKSATTGASSTVTAAIAAGSGTDISARIKLTAATYSYLANGIVAESALQCVTIMDGLATPWYGLQFASSNIVDADRVAVAAYIEGSTNPHIFGTDSASTNLLNPSSTTDIAYVLSAAGYKRTFVQYSQIPYVSASVFGRFLTTDFTQNNSVITLMYKQEPGVTPETLTSAQAAALDAKRCNYFSNYNNGTAILQNGVMSGSAFIDEIQGLDWLQNNIQTNVYNLLYTSNTKVPQTDAGMAQIVTVIEASCEAARNNGLVAPGTWTSGGFGTLKMGDFLPKGYYVYAPPVASQASADRQARKAVPMQVAVKLAGAVHNVNITVNVNR